MLPVFFEELVVQPAAHVARLVAFMGLPPLSPGQPRHPPKKGKMGGGWGGGFDEDGVGDCGREANK